MTLTGTSESLQRTQSTCAVHEKEGVGKPEWKGTAALSEVDQSADNSSNSADVERCLKRPGGDVVMRPASAPGCQEGAARKTRESTLGTLECAQKTPPYSTKEQCTVGFIQEQHLPSCMVLLNCFKLKWSRIAIGSREDYTSQVDSD